MIRIACLLSFAIFFLQDGEPTPTSLEGRWVATRLEVDGADEDAKVVKSFRVHVKQGALLFKPSGTIVRRATFELDPSTTPKTVVMTVHEDDMPDRTVKGIYAFEDGKWKLCVPNFDRDAKTLPTEFKTRPGDGFVFMELRRVTPK
jgi:uncharacterized protein (TIGR03067 family)